MRWSLSVSRRMGCKLFFYYRAQYSCSPLFFILGRSVQSGLKSFIFNRYPKYWFLTFDLYSQIKRAGLKPLSKTMWQPPPPHPFCYQAPATVGYLRSCMCHHHLREDSFVITSRQFGIDWCLQCAFQGLVPSFFLESIMLFSRKQTDPHPQEMLSLSPPLPAQRHLLERHLLQPENFWNPSSTRQTDGT